MINWEIFDKENQYLCEIKVFDDGNHILEHKFKNIWIVIGTNNKGKCRLINYFDQTFILNSISHWKLEYNNISID
jgi:hypothetical protein